MKLYCFYCACTCMQFNTNKDYFDSKALQDYPLKQGSIYHNVENCNNQMFKLFFARSKSTINYKIIMHCNSYYIVTAIKLQSQFLDVLYLKFILFI